jgi:Holliday junction resolvase-like predicted endonuclease
LEEWIEREPGLLEEGLTIVGRQVQLAAGPVDLLAVDPQGQWVVVELKRAAVRRDAVAQALDYASCVASMAYEELAQAADAYLTRSGGGRSLDALLRERGTLEAARGAPRDVRIFVAGAGQDVGLDRLVGYLAGAFGVPIAAVSYGVFALPDGERVLIRQRHEAEAAQTPALVRPVTVESVLARLGDTAAAGAVRQIAPAAAERHGLHARPYKSSVMFTPPDNRTRCLFTVWLEPRASGALRAWISGDGFAEFYGARGGEVEHALGALGWREFPPAEAPSFVAGLDGLFALIRGRGSDRGQNGEPVPV